MASETDNTKCADSPKNAEITHKYDPPESSTSVGWTHACQVTLADEANPFVTENGEILAPLVVEYETYGELAPDRSNVILIAHALSGDAHVAGWDADALQTGRTWRLTRPGWWDDIVGPDKPMDTKKYFFVCANIIGSCYGTTGPESINPATGKPYGLDFPIVTVGDWVKMEAMLLDYLGIETLYAIVGGSLGGQQALEFSLAYPDRVKKCIILASGPKLPAQGLGFNAVARYCIQNDPQFHGGNYYGTGENPQSGLAAARMLAHITYLSGKGMDTKFGRRWQEDIKTRRKSFGIEFAVESYLNHQGSSFVKRFDADSYLYIIRAMDYYDAAASWGDGDLVKACSRFKAQVMIVTFSSDWLYPPEECKPLVTALMRNKIPVTYVKVESSYGHDAFLVEVDKVGRLLRAFLQSQEPDDSAVQPTKEEQP